MKNKNNKKRNKKKKTVSKFNYVKYCIITIIVILIGAGIYFFLIAEDEDTSLTILERHPHKVLSLPPLDPEEPYGLDATVYEGWLDLKAKNNTTQKYQILITFDEKYIYGTLCTDGEILYSYEIYNRNVVEFQKEGRSFIKFEVWRRKKEKSLLETIQDEFLYSQEVELTYKRTTSISRMY